jgi:hypothetical protein
VPPATAADRETAFELTALLQLRSAIADADEAFTAPLLASHQPLRGMEVKAGATARSMVRKVLAEFKPRATGRLAARAAGSAGILSPRAVAEVQGHAREAEEILALVLETDALDPFKRNLDGSEPSFMRVAQISFLHSALMAARAQVDAAVACFGEEERFSAAELLLAVAPSSGSAAADGPSERARERERERRVAIAIDALPSEVGTGAVAGALRRALWRG